MTNIDSSLLLNKQKEEMFVDIINSWEDIKLILLNPNKSEILLNANKIIDLLHNFCRNLHTYAKSNFQDKEGGFFIHGVNNKIGYLMARLSDPNYYRNADTNRKKECEDELTESIEASLISIPLILKIANTQELKQFSLNDILHFLNLEKNFVSEKESILQCLNFKHSFLQLTLIFDELITNASKHGSQKRDLVITAQRNSGFLEVKMVDTGKGMSKITLSRVLKSLRETSEEIFSTSGNGGFGLRSIKRLGIGVGIDSKGVNMGSTVTLSIPIEEIEG